MATEGTDERRGRPGRGARRIDREAFVPLPPGFYLRDASSVARGLLGMLLVSTIDDATAVGRIVETEAYTGPEDDASHASARIGRTPRNEPMFGSAGHAYVYRIYGIHWCLNAVTGDEGHPAAVLIRAAEPVVGLGTMRIRRRPGRDEHLMRGPGNLCRALAITGAVNRHPLDRPPLLIARGESVPDDRTAAGPRVGVTRATDLPLRFRIVGSPAVSRP